MRFFRRFLGRSFFLLAFRSRPLPLLLIHRPLAIISVLAGSPHPVQPPPPLALLTSHPILRASYRSLRTSRRFLLRCRSRICTTRLLRIPSFPRLPIRPRTQLILNTHIPLALTSPISILPSLGRSQSHPRLLVRFTTPRPSPFSTSSRSSSSSTCSRLPRGMSFTLHTTRSLRHGLLFLQSRTLSLETSCPILHTPSSSRRRWLTTRTTAVAPSRCPRCWQEEAARDLPFPSRATVLLAPLLLSCINISRYLRSRSSPTRGTTLPTPPLARQTASTRSMQSTLSSPPSP